MTSLQAFLLLIQKCCYFPCEKIKIFGKKDMSVDPVACDSGLLANLAALSNQIYNPVAPYPVFYSTANCGSALTGSNFPTYFMSINCPQNDNTLPTPDNNCLRIIDNLDGKFNPFSGPRLSSNQVNFLPGATKGGTQVNSIFTDPNARLYSWYTPVQFTIIFYQVDPSESTRDVAATSGYYISNSNELMVDACLTKLTLNNGSTFFSYGNNDDKTPCPLQYCDACQNPNNPPVPPGPYCVGTNGPISQNFDYSSCPGVTHRAPYFIVIKNREFSDILLDMCLNNLPVTYGSNPNNNLNQVWAPQNAACDNYITSICSSSNVSSSPYAELCSCFTQQQALNHQYGASLEVPVCCFGTDPSGDISKSCSFNSKAYKTGQMLRSCCSFAECQQVINQTPSMANNADNGTIACDGKFVSVPIVCYHLSLSQSLVQFLYILGLFSQLQCFC